MAAMNRWPHTRLAAASSLYRTAPVDAYRGAGRPEATYVVERLVTRCAWDLGLSQDEIRKRNFISQWPYQT
jgi:carbon-monoxide dehydrogenase large subunit